MTLDIELELEKTFAEALKQHAASKLRTGEDWAKYREIEEDHERLRNEERRDFTENFDTRIETARQKAIAEAGTPKLEHPTPFGTDHFDKNTIEQRALQIVEHDHEQSLADIDVAEAEAQYQLTEAVRERDKPELGRDFKRAAEPGPSISFQRS
jgi:hypothetical protein